MITHYSNLDIQYRYYIKWQITSSVDGNEMGEGRNEQHGHEYLCIVWSDSVFGLERKSGINFLRAHDSRAVEGVMNGLDLSVHRQH